MIQILEACSILPQGFAKQVTLMMMNAEDEDVLEVVVAVVVRIRHRRDRFIKCGPRRYFRAAVRRRDGPRWSSVAGCVPPKSWWRNE